MQTGIPFQCALSLEGVSSVSFYQWQLSGQHRKCGLCVPH